MTTLAQRISEPDLVNLADWQVAEILNRPDPELPERVEVISRTIDIGDVLTALGVDPGAAFLDTLKAAGEARRALFYAFDLLQNGRLDAGNPVLRSEIQAMLASGSLATEVAVKLLALGENRRLQSWAEHWGIEVTARVVSLARNNRP